jgi:hypothetical protein
MPVYSFQQIIDSSLDQLSPGAKVLLSSFHRTPGGGFAGSTSIIRESLRTKDGKYKAMCGATIVGKDDVCQK